MQKIYNNLKASGSKLTVPRKQVIDFLSDSPKPVTLKEIHENCNNIDFASVYRAIKLLIKLKIAEEIISADKKIRYKIPQDEHNHHIICEKCGAVEEIPICFLSNIKNLTNYIITKHTLEFMGLCPECKK